MDFKITVLALARNFEIVLMAKVPDITFFYFYYLFSRTNSRFQMIIKVENCELEVVVVAIVSGSVMMTLYCRQAWIVTVICTLHNCLLSSRQVFNCKTFPKGVQLYTNWLWFASNTVVVVVILYNAVKEQSRGLIDKIVVKEVISANWRVKEKKFFSSHNVNHQSHFRLRLAW